MFVAFAFIPWLVGVVSSLAAYFGALLAKKWAVRAALVTAIIGLTTAFTALIFSLVSALDYVDPDNYFIFGLKLLPANTFPCISAYVSCLIARVVYNQKYDFMSRWIDGGL